MQTKTDYRITREANMWAVWFRAELVKLYRSERAAMNAVTRFSRLRRLTEAGHMSSRTEILTSDEAAFAKRMLPHFMAGKSPEEAARAVLEDDGRLLGALLSSGPAGMHHGAAGDGAAMVSFGPTEAASGLRSEISSRVYRRLRAGA